MSLHIYREISTGTYSRHEIYGVDDDTSPITATHDGSLGEVVIKQLFVRADRATEWYSDIEAVPVSLASPNEVDGTTTGHGVKLIRSTIQPTEAEWDATDYENTISFPDIGSAIAGDSSTYHSFWCRIECPAGTTADNRENTVVRVFWTANAVS